MKKLVAVLIFVASFALADGPPATSQWKRTGPTTIAPRRAVDSVAIGTTVLPGTAIGTTSATTVNLAAGNNGQQIAFTAGTDVTLNLTSTVAVQGFTLLIIQRGAGSVIPTASGGGITIRQRQSYTKTAGQYAVATLSCDIAGDCILAGDLQ